MCSQVLHLDAVQERTEQRSEAYKRYVERVAEVLTRQRAKRPAELTALRASRLAGAKDAR